MALSIPRLVRFTLLVFVALSLMGGVSQEEEVRRNARLRGEFDFTNTRSCVSNRARSRIAIALLAGTWAKETVSRGMITYNGDGTGSLEADWLEKRNLVPAASGRSMSGGIVTCDLSYRVYPDGSFTQEAICESETLTGPGAGEAWLIEDIRMEGQITMRGKFMMLSDTAPNVEFLTRLWPETEPPERAPVRKRVCHRSSYAVSRSPKYLN